MKHFQPRELVDRKTYEKMGDGCLILFDTNLLIALDDLREYFDRPITVNTWHYGGLFEWRGYRTPEKARQLGAPKSLHARGMAIDCDIEGYSAEQARRKILQNQDHELLSRIMRLEGKVSWLHFDLLPVPDRIHVFKV